MDSLKARRGENQCACCGRFKSWRELFGYDDQGCECFDCLSQFDRERLKSEIEARGLKSEQIDSYLFLLIF